LLCSYLLSLPDLPPSPRLDRSYSPHELPSRIDNQDRHTTSSQTETEVGDGWIVLGQGQKVFGVQVTEPGLDSGVEGPLASPSGSAGDLPRGPYALSTRSTTSSTTTISRPSPPQSVKVSVASEPVYNPINVGDEDQPGDLGQQDRLDGRVDQVFRLHSSRRMKPTSTGRGVSIPSRAFLLIAQPRWCRYIHLIFTKQEPKSYFDNPALRVRLVSVTLILKPPTGWRKPLASLLIGSGGGEGKAWASVARYDDGYVERLKQRGGIGDGVAGEITWGGIGEKGEYDTKKMFRSCGKMISSHLTEEEKQALMTDHEVSYTAASMLIDRTTSSIT
jgi:phosphatidylinositol-3,4,5-trisphosphate 3-phosphatase/dual-specificity protein phosphatase PTEN